MKPLSRLLSALAVAILALAAAVPAGAANVTVGPSLAGEWESEECGLGACVFANDQSGTGVSLASPITGAIVRFSVVGGQTAGTYTLRTLNWLGNSNSAAAFRKLSSPIAAVPAAGVQTYATSLPVTAGETIGLGMSETASVGFRNGIGRFVLWTGPRPESGPELASLAETGLVGFNVEVQPPPSIASMSPDMGPTTGGTTVVITGTDFEGASAVTFGGIPATSFVVDSESQITAVAPPSPVLGSVSIGVTTVAGTVARGVFGYISPPLVTTPTTTRCVVPKLEGKKLRAAKKALRQAHCAIGLVKKREGATIGTGEVATQSRKSGAVLPAGTSVSLTLKPPKAVKHKHG